MKFLSPEFALHLYRSTIQPYMKYCCHVWADVLLVATWNYKAVGPSLAASL